MDIIPQTDPRIQEIVALAQEDGRPLALAAETICALEDNGWLADPFTAQLWPDPARQQTALPGMVIMLVSADLKAQAMPA
ncbi:MAG: hypothetical protein WBO29_01795 [Albidovulum sp.]